MGNCLGSGGVVEDMVKVVTPNGGVMELYATITAECITNEFPCYDVFPSRRRRRHHSRPLHHHDNLSPGQRYYPLPLPSQKSTSQENSNANTAERGAQSRTAAANQGRYNQNSAGEGEWKVRLVIGTDQLSEILWQEARTEALIETVRTVAKCAAGFRRRLIPIRELDAEQRDLFFFG